MGVCPRDGTALTAGSGALGEDVCSSCQGRWLDAPATQRLFVDVMGIGEGVLRELAREGPARVACPSCRTMMTEAWARGVQVDLCTGCGAAWLDGGELSRLAREVLEEVRVTQAPASMPGGPLELDLSSRAPPRRFQFEVRCVNCDATLDLSRTNWLINTRPWCPDCAAPYTGLFAAFQGGWLGAILSFVLGAVFSRGLWTRGADFGSGSLDKSPDVLRISPADADKYFGAFYTLVR